MKTLFFEFLLDFYINNILEDWSVTTKLGKIYYYPFWIIRSIFMWIISPLWLVPFFIKRTDTYKDFQTKMEIYLK
jgi:hypothetical protein